MIVGKVFEFPSKPEQPGLSSSICLEVTMEQTWYANMTNSNGVPSPLPTSSTFTPWCQGEWPQWLLPRLGPRSINVLESYCWKNCFLQYVSIKWASDLQSCVLSAPSGIVDSLRLNKPVWKVIDNYVQSLFSKDSCDGSGLNTSENSKDSHP